MARIVSAAETSREWAHHLDDTLERWRIRRGMEGWTGNELRVMPAKAFRRLISDMTRVDLLALKEILDEINADVTAQLKDPGRYIGDYRDWKYGATKVQAVVGKRSAAIQNRLSEIKKQRKADYIAHFMRAAEDRLTPELFEELKEEAGRRFRYETREDK